MALSLPVHTHEPELSSPEERRRPKNIVETVAPGSLAEAAGVCVRDRVLTVNGEPIHDIVDWRFHRAGEEVSLTFLRDETEYTVTLHKGYDEDLGLTFAEDLFDGIHICKNKCVFCFLYQQPKGL